MKTDTLNKRTTWETFYDKLKLETDQNKELVKRIVINLADKNEKLKATNDALLSALKDTVNSLEHAINATQTGTVRNLLTDANILAQTAIKNASE